MIKTKEDLLNTCVPTSDKKLLDLFIETAEGFGCKWYLDSELRDVHKYVAVDSLGELHRNTIVPRKRKQLTLTDFEPEVKKMKVEYVKVRESLFSLRPDFDNGELFTTGECDDWVVVGDETTLARMYVTGGLYRQVETEVTWRDVAIPFFEEFGLLEVVTDLSYVNSRGNTAYQSQFIEMCRNVTAMEKPE